MGISTKSIPFFADNITLMPHTASHARHVGGPVSLRQFARGQSLRLEQVQETGEYIATRANGDFIQGPEA